MGSDSLLKKKNFSVAKGFTWNYHLIKLSDQLANLEQAGPSLTTGAVNTSNGHQGRANSGKTQIYHALHWLVELLRTHPPEKGRILVFIQNLLIW